MTSELSALAQKLPLSVTQLNRQVRFWLESEMNQVQVVGELSNLSKPGSGHLYFTLKDTGAQIRCVYFRNSHTIKTRFFKDGQQVIAQGKLSLYEARGDYQLIVDDLIEVGLGELYKQFELLKTKLQAQGLFDSARKKSIPRFPVSIGIITSATGAALQDILSTLKRRYPIASIKIYACEVQGKAAALQLINALTAAIRHKACDVLILARGGGSIEDLCAFNDENLALAISNCPIPLVSGVGHETDFTIADFVADLRAATPTAAAEAVTPNQFELSALLCACEKRLLATMMRFLQHHHLLLSNNIKRISSPEHLISRHWQTLDYLERHLLHALQRLIHQKQNKLAALNTALQTYNPKTALGQSKAALQHFTQRLLHSVYLNINVLKQQLGHHMATLHAVSPLATLDRGYAIATHNKKIIFNASQVEAGDTIEVRLAAGQLHCEVINK